MKYILNSILYVSILYTAYANSLPTWSGANETNVYEFTHSLLDISIDPTLPLGNYDFTSFTGIEWETFAEVNLERGFEATGDIFDPIVLTDKLNISGFSRHVIAPHLEGATNEVFEFNFEVLAHEYERGFHTIYFKESDPLFNVIQHEEHFDLFSAQLDFQIEGGNIISYYNLKVEGLHIGVSEPSTFALFLLGLTSLLLYRRKHHNQ